MLDLPNTCINHRQLISNDIIQEVLLPKQEVYYKSINDSSEDRKR